MYAVGQVGEGTYFGRKLGKIADGAMAIGEGRE